MHVQFWLSDDDRPCVFCGHVSPKGVVAQVGQHRFFACADCIGSIIPEFIEERVRHLVPFKGESLHCVCCGKNSGNGLILELKMNWSFTCEKCAKEVIPAILGGWRLLKNIGKVRRRVKKKQEILTHEKRKVEENLPECPKCKAAMESDWTECPFCGHKLKKESPPTKVKSIRTALPLMVGINNKELLSILTYLKVFRKRIAIHARYSYQKSQLARQKAIKLRRKGDDDGSRVQMKTHLQMQVSQNNLENVQLKLVGLQNKFEQTKTMKEVSDILTDIARTVQNLSKMVSPPETAQMAEMFLRKIADWGLFP